MNRVFLDWKAPGLRAAADYLLETKKRSGTIDLSDTIVAVPGNRAGRRLLEILVDRADREDAPLVPPEIVTVGRLPELLYTTRKPFAGDFVQHLAWIEAIRQINDNRLKNLAQSLPENDDLNAWMAFSAMLSRLHRELAADGLDFSEVASRVGRLRSVSDQNRWQVLAEIQRAYLDTLSRLSLWDLQTARRYAIDHRECAIDRDLVLLGTVDLNRQQRLMLDQVGQQVTALVIAPESLHHRFDDYGCLIPDAWKVEPIDLIDDQIVLADDPADQAAKMMEAIDRLQGRFAAEDITLGVPDQEVVPYLEQALVQEKIPTRYGAGTPLRRTAPYRILHASAEFLTTGRYQAFAALVRHPDLQAWLKRQGIEGDWLSDLDRAYNDHLPYLLATQESMRHEAGALWTRVHQEVMKFLAPLKQKRCPLRDWRAPIVELLVALYGNERRDPRKPDDHLIIEACQRIDAVLHRYQALPESLEPRTRGAEALRLLLRQIQNESIPPLPGPGAIELLGWLELPLDDAPVLVVTGFNEGFIPSSLNGDLFLPNRLRRELGIEDNDRRFARDAYALGVIAASSRELKLIAGRRRADSEPLYPSRLLFACNETEAAHRALDLFSSRAPSSRDQELSGTLRAGREHSRIPVPAPLPLAERVTSMRVTEFRDYLACPYRYYLRHRLGLERIDDAAEELDGGAFGSLAHAVLGEFGHSRVAGSDDFKAIAAWLDRALDRISAARYSKTALAAVHIQIEQLRKRLRSFAQWQAGWAARGWKIVHVEKSPLPEKCALLVDGQPLFLRGRIDRIDTNADTGESILLDYKTGNTPVKPDKAHRRQGEWIDLQLPLYRHLAGALGIQDPIQLGYVVLPSDPKKTDVLIAEWTEADLKEADRVAEDVARAVRKEKFWPPAESPTGFFNDFSAICQDDHFGRLVIETESEEGDAA